MPVKFFSLATSYLFDFGILNVIIFLSFCGRTLSSSCTHITILWLFVYFCLTFLLLLLALNISRLKFVEIAHMLLYLISFWFWFCCCGFQYELYGASKILSTFWFSFNLFFFVAVKTVYRRWKIMTFEFYYYFSFVFFFFFFVYK